MVTPARRQPVADQARPEARRDHQDVSDAIKALVTHSANDAAVVIAENLAGTEENFARLMTETARRIGMKNTIFRNASGLPNDEQVTTARDMAILAAQHHPRLPGILRRLRDALFQLQGPQATATTTSCCSATRAPTASRPATRRASGFNLTASVKRDNKHLVAVVLGGKTGSQRDAAMRALLDKNLAAASTAKPTPAQSHGRLAR